MISIATESLAMLFMVILIIMSTVYSYRITNEIITSKMLKLLKMVTLHYSLTSSLILPDVYVYAREGQLCKVMVGKEFPYIFENCGRYYFKIIPVIMDGNLVLLAVTPIGSLMFPYPPAIFGFSYSTKSTGTEIEVPREGVSTTGLGYKAVEEIYSTLYNLVRYGEGRWSPAEPLYYLLDDSGTYSIFYPSIKFDAIENGRVLIVNEYLGGYKTNSYTILKIDDLRYICNFVECGINPDEFEKFKIKVEGVNENLRFCRVIGIILKAKSPYIEVDVICAV